MSNPERFLRVAAIAALVAVVGLCWLAKSYMTDYDILAVIIVGANILATLAIAAALYGLARWARRRP